MQIDYVRLIDEIRGALVPRPNRAGRGTLSGHAAGEPFEKAVCQHLKALYPGRVFKQYEFLNWLYASHPECTTGPARLGLVASPVAAMLLNRGAKATAEWTAQRLFEEKQNDTADMLCVHNEAQTRYELIDVKTRNVEKNAQAPNIISATKLAHACAAMLECGDFDSVDLRYVEIDWREEAAGLRCVDACCSDLFLSVPATLYINWAAARQLQFHVRQLDQSWAGGREAWARRYLAAFVASARRQQERLFAECVEPFERYL